ncbi:hypothetical protein [Bacillus mycoides]|uniref:hypothetical protein n=1 Tax=Bacillus mycoides TaxID=1405 RepID=UPI00027C177F|nr:hypothetical protein [Bacillus mycoides]EJV59312.1 hypothetical protein IEU_05577 [Bacillus mycoides]
MKLSFTLEDGTKLLTSVGDHVKKNVIAEAVAAGGVIVTDDMIIRGSEVIHVKVTKEDTIS